MLKYKEYLENTKILTGVTKTISLFSFRHPSVLFIKRDAVNSLGFLNEMLATMCM